MTIEQSARAYGDRVDVARSRLDAAERSIGMYAARTRDEAMEAAHRELVKIAGDSIGDMRFFPCTSRVPGRGRIVGNCLKCRGEVFCVDRDWGTGRSLYHTCNWKPDLNYFYFDSPFTLCRAGRPILNKQGRYVPRRT